MSIINATTADFNAVGGPPTRIEQALGGEVTARLLGFLRPPHTWENVREQLRICVSYSTASLRLAPAENLVVRFMKTNFFEHILLSCLLIIYVL